MPGFDPEKINIHELTVEEPEKESGEIFDVERDITAEDREMMHNRLDELRTEKKSYQEFDGEKHYSNWLYFAKLAAEMAIIGENPGIVDDDFVQLKKELDFRRKKDQWKYFAELAENLKILGENVNISEKEWVEIEKAFNKWRGTSMMDENLAVSMAILGKASKFTAKDLLHMDSGVAIARMAMARMDKNTAQAEQWGRILSVSLAQHRILGLNYELSASDWKQMKAGLDWMRGPRSKSEDKEGFSAAASSMAILAAEKVKITEKGLEVIMPKKNNFKLAPQMPEQRIF